MECALFKHRVKYMKIISILHTALKAVAIYVSKCIRLPLLTCRCFIVLSKCVQ